MTNAPRSDFAGGIAAAIPCQPVISSRHCPDGRRMATGRLAKNPTRLDRRAGSCEINLKSGPWPDFAAADEWGGPDSLVAHIPETPQVYRWGLVAPKFGRALMGGAYAG